MRGVVVIGIGNPYRHDDAAGLEVARLVEASTIAGVSVVEHDGEPAGLLDLWAGAETAYLVDALRADGPAGTVHTFELAADGILPDRRGRDSSHALALGDAIELAQVLDRLPQHLVIIGIEGVEFGAGIGLTPEVSDAVQAVSRRIIGELTQGRSEVRPCA